MKYPLLLALTLFLNFHIAYGQSKYQNGYFIDNTNKKTECLIKNIDWIHNPEAFEYKLATEDKPKKLTVHDVKEFGIYNTAKFIRAENLPLEISAHTGFDLSDSSQFDFVENTVFLKYEVEGPASLLSHEDKEKVNFFYSKGNGSPKPLLYKPFYIRPKIIAKNEQYKEELTKELSCTTSTLNTSNMRYSRSSLTNYFLAYNACVSGNNTATKVYQNQSKFNITLKGGVGFATQTFLDIKHEFFVPQVGIEVEYIFPRLHKKFSVLVDPNFSMANDENKASDLLYATYKYKGLNVPVGGRYYYHINSTSSLYTTAMFGIRFLAGTKRELHKKGYTSSSFTHTYDGNYQSSSFILSGGIGYRHGKRIRTEIKYTSDIDQQGGSPDAKKTISNQHRLQKIDLAIGYTIN